MKISAPTKTSARLPCFLFLFVTLAIFATTGFKSGLPSYTEPFLFVKITSSGPKVCNNLQIESPAAPAPATTIFKSFHSFFIIFKEFIIPAVTTMAVPCWSSWNTGISNSALSLSSISKHLGEEISSKLIPPKVGEIYFTVFIISSGSFVSKQIGNASTPPNSLNKTDFPSITGIAASGPISPKPKTAVPSETTATVWPFIVYLKTSFLFSAIFLQGSATPGV